MLWNASPSSPDTGPPRRLFVTLETRPVGEYQSEMACQWTMASNSRTKYLMLHFEPSKLNRVAPEDTSSGPTPILDEETLVQCGES